MIKRSGFLLAVFALSLVQSNSLRIIGRSPLNSHVEQRSDTDDNRQGLIWNIYRRFAGTTDSSVQNNIKDIDPEQYVDQNVNDNDSDIDKDYDNGDKNDQELEEIHSTTTTTVAPPQISYPSPYYLYKSQPASHTQSVFSTPPYYPSSSLPNSYTQSMYNPIYEYGDMYSKPPPPPLPLPPLINITYSPVLAPVSNSSTETTTVTDPIISSKDIRAELADLILKSLTQNSDIQVASNPLQSYQNPFVRSPAFIPNASPVKLYKTINSGPFVVTSNGGSYDLSNYQQVQDDQQYYVSIPVEIIQNAFEDDEDDSQQKYYVPSRKSHRFNYKHQSNMKTSRPSKARKQKRKYTSGGKRRKSSSQRRRKHLKKQNTLSDDDELIYITVNDANLISNGKQFVNDDNKYY